MAYIHDGYISSEYEFNNSGRGPASGLSSQLDGHYAKEKVGLDRSFGKQDSSCVSNLELESF